MGCFLTLNPCSWELLLLVPTFSSKICMQGGAVSSAAEVFVSFPSSPWFPSDLCLKLSSGRWDMLSCSLCEFLLDSYRLRSCWFTMSEKEAEKKQRVHANWLLSPFPFIQVPHLQDAVVPQPGLPHSVFVPHASHLWKAPHRYTQKCAFPVSTASFATAKLLSFLSILLSLPLAAHFTFTSSAVVRKVSNNNNNRLSVQSKMCVLCNTTWSQNSFLLQVFVCYVVSR